MRKSIIAVFAGAVLLLLGIGPTPVQATHLSCGDTVVASTKLDGNLFCVDGPGLIVGADGVTIQFKNFDIFCTGTGFLGSCQGIAGAVGIDTGGFNNVLIKGTGTIDGFDVGVLVVNGTNVNVRRLVVTGPASPGVGSNDRNGSSTTQPAGILVQNTVCPVDFETIINIHGNTVSNHRDGIKLVNAGCVNVGKNNTNNNDDDPVACHGIVLISSSDNNINGNTVFANGENLGGDSGIQLQGSSTGNTVVGNDASGNCGDGIQISSPASGNNVVNNEARGNPIATLTKCSASTFFFDFRDTNPVVANNWNDNNECITSSGSVPGTVCNPGE